MAIALGIGMVLGAGTALLVWRFITAQADFPADADVVFPRWLFHNFGALAAVTLAMGLVAIVAGAAILRLKAWARPILEALAWLALTWVLGFAFAWLRTAASLASRIPKDQSFPAPVFIGMGAGMAIAYGAAVVLAIRALRSDAMRSALGRAAP